MSQAWQSIGCHGAGGVETVERLAGAVDDEGIPCAKRRHTNILYIVLGLYNSPHVEETAAHLRL